MAIDIVYLHYYLLIRCYIHSEWLNHYYQSCFGIMSVDTMITHISYPKRTRKKNIVYIQLVVEIKRREHDHVGEISGWIFTNKDPVSWPHESILGEYIPEIKYNLKIGDPLSSVVSLSTKKIKHSDYCWVPYCKKIRSVRIKPTQIWSEPHRKKYSINIYIYYIIYIYTLLYIWKTATFCQWVL